MVRVELIVRPREGVRDPQGDAVQESLRGLGYTGLSVQSVGRTLTLDLDVASEAQARQTAEEMCRRLLVNPSLETYELRVTTP